MRIGASRRPSEILRELWGRVAEYWELRLKLVVREAESEALIEAIGSARPTLAASFVVETELRRVVHRVPELSQALVTSLLDRVDRTR